MNLRTVDQIISQLPRSDVPRLPPPNYTYREGRRIGLAVESMKRHMTDEGWQIFQALEERGYELYGYGFGNSLTNVGEILTISNPAVVFVQDKREWDAEGRDFREVRARFTNVEYLKSRSDIFKLTIIKDSHQRAGYHRQSADEIGCHAWITYYNPRIVCHLAPYVRPEHLIRTYHTLDPQLVPMFNPAAARKGCLLSGAVSNAYPLRQRLVHAHRTGRLPQVEMLNHPGYHRNGCQTPAFLQLLNNYRVSICTSSMYGYALRKIMESVACGCRVITDLPCDDVLPEIDKNLIRVPHSSSVEHISELINHLTDTYDEDEQRHFSQKARAYYDYKAMGVRLNDSIEHLRLHYRETI